MFTNSWKAVNYMIFTACGLGKPECISSTFTHLTGNKVNQLTVHSISSLSPILSSLSNLCFIFSHYSPGQRFSFPSSKDQHDNKCISSQFGLPIVDITQYKVADYSPKNVSPAVIVAQQTKPTIASPTIVSLSSQTQPTMNSLYQFTTNHSAHFLTNTSLQSIGHNIDDKALKNIKKNW